jgi:pSer/pThr/pTyr-binding forkhead associated (FHA) protein
LEVIGEGLVFELQKQRTAVGRDLTADIQIDDSGLSRRHFEILWDGAKAGIRDLGSTNGTFVSGAKIAEQALPLDTVIKAGNKTFVFKVVAEAVTE